MTSTKNENVSTSQGACVFCNTFRPIDEVLCPACGRGWIDTSASDSADSVARAEAATIATDAALENRRSEHRKAWWLVVLVAAIIFGSYWVVVTMIGDSGEADPEPITIPTTAPTTTAAVELPQTTLPPPGTTVAPTTPTTSAPATTTTVPLLASGDPIPIDDLRLGAVELGGFAFGTPVDVVLPRLVGTFGQPTSIIDASTEWGTCESDSGRVFAFGGLHIVTIDTSEGAEFAGFVVEPSGSASDGLTTFSGIGLGATIAEMDETYRSFQSFVDNGTATWVVSSFNDGHTLLWGTAAGDSAGSAVDRIASPRACDGGPTAG